MRLGSAIKSPLFNNYLRDLLRNVGNDRVENRLDVWQRNVCAKVD